MRFASIRLVLTIVTFLSAQSVFAISFPNLMETTETTGINHRYTGGWEYFVGGGVAAFDCNQDRKPELFFAGGEGLSALYLNISETAGAINFLEQKNSPLAMDAVTGAYPLDIDSDGLQDLVVLRLGENRLFRGTGNCSFEPANSLWNVDGGNAWTTAFSAMWEKDQLLPTLAFGNYVDRDQPGSPFGTCHDNDLIRPSSESQYNAPIVLSPSYCTLSMLFSDWNRQGKTDLRVTNDRQYYRGGQDQLWNMQAETPPLTYTSSDGWRRLKVWGMGLAATDLTGDGKPDYYITSMADNKLQTLASRDGSPDFTDVAFEKGITAHRPFAGGSILPSTGWHAQFDDINNDSYADLFVVKGNVEAMTDFAMLDPNNLLLGSPSGRFTESAEQAGMLSYHRGRGGSLVDLNLDGLLDVIVVNREEKVQVWLNQGQRSDKNQISAPMGNWVALELQQEGSNRNAIGAWVEVRIADRTQVREITIGGGHAGGKTGWHHFGLGVAERALVRVKWPHGEWGPWVRLFANQFVRITRGESVAEVWVPVPPDS